MSFGKRLKKCEGACLSCVHILLSCRSVSSDELKYLLEEIPKQRVEYVSLLLLTAYGKAQEERKKSRMKCVTKRDG